MEVACEKKTLTKLLPCSEAARDGAPRQNYSPLASPLNHTQIPNLTTTSHLLLLRTHPDFATRPPVKTFAFSRKTEKMQPHKKSESTNDRTSQGSNRRRPADFNASAQAPPAANARPPYPGFANPLMAPSFHPQPPNLPQPPSPYFTPTQVPHRAPIFQLPPPRQNHQYAAIHGSIAVRERSSSTSNPAFLRPEPTQLGTAADSGTGKALTGHDGYRAPVRSDFPANADLTKSYELALAVREAQAYQAPPLLSKN